MLHNAEAKRGSCGSVAEAVWGDRKHVANRSSPWQQCLALPSRQDAKNNRISMVVCFCLVVLEYLLVHRQPSKSMRAAGLSSFLVSLGEMGEKFRGGRWDLFCFRRNN